MGSDFDTYADWMDQNGVSRKLIKRIDSEYCAQAYITTDLEDNQITAFHPGAMNHAHVQKVPTDAGVTIGIVAPDGRDGMIQHAEQFASADIPFIFDPGQGLPMFDGDDLRHFLELATYVAVNDYESEMLRERTGFSMGEVAERVDAYIVTRGGDGASIHAHGTEIRVPAAKPAQVADPTGCGDAFRAGLIYGLQNDMDWDTIGRLSAAMGAIKIEQHGTQNHRFSAEEFAQRFKAEFGYAL